MKRVEIKIENRYFKKMQEKADLHGFNSMTDFILFCCLNSTISCNIGPKEILEKELPDIKFAYMMLKDKMINENEFERIKAVLIEKLENPSVKQPYKTIKAGATPEEALQVAKKLCNGEGK